MGDFTNITKVKFMINDKEVKPMDSSFHCGSTNKRDDTMKFRQALEVLDILEYGDRIWNSHSKGDLFHIQSYIDLAIYINSIENKQEQKAVVAIFKKNFVAFVNYAYNKWKRPQSVYQHVVEEVCRRLI